MTDAGKESKGNSIERSFELSEQRLLIGQSYIGAWLMLFLIPAGISLDYFVYPDRLERFSLFRLCADLPVVAAIVLHRRPEEGRWPRLGIALWLGSAIVMICLMVYETEGARSSYYVGLVLALLAVGILLPLRISDVVIMGISTHLLYGLACFAPMAAPFEMATFFTANYFLILAVIISATAVHFSRRRRLSEFSLRQELEWRNQQLAELDAMKSRFFANVSHELRTPLTMILAPVQELLMRSELKPSMAVALKTIEASGLRLLRLVNDLLDLVRFEQAAPQFERKPVALDAILRALVEQVRYMAQQNNVTLTADIEQRSLIVLGDDVDLERVFINLLSNAIKFTDAGGEIVVRARLVERSVIVDVQDTGIGMSDADAERVFDRFQQAVTSGSRRAQGMGLGLALVKELLARHGGTIAVETQLGLGTTMQVKLPAALDQLPTREHAADSDPVALQRQAWLSGPQDIAVDWAANLDPVGAEDAPVVLVVDDEPEIRRFLATMLAQEFRVLQAEDGVRGLNLIGTARPAIIVLDLMLPGLDGLEVCRRVKEDATLRSTKILLLTARIDESAKLEALAHGVDDFLTKPFSTVELRTRLRNLHRSAQLEHELRVQNDDLREALRRLRQAEVELLQREKLSSLGTMAAGLLHEINNPLNYTGMAIGVARKHALVRSDRQLNEMIADMDAGVKRVQAIVSDLRTFATSQPVEHAQPFNVSRMVAQAIRFAATELSRNEVTVDVSVDLMAAGIEQQISQVLVNLLINAGRACSLATDRNGRIEVRAAIRGDRVQVSVEDNGVGISDEQKTRVFDPFYTTSEVGKGMGLGLSVSHSIVERHGGFLNVKSHLNAGSTFTFDVAHHVAEHLPQRSHVSVC